LFPSIRERVQPLWKFWNATARVAVFDGWAKQRRAPRSCIRGGYLAPVCHSRKALLLSDFVPVVTCLKQGCPAEQSRRCHLEPPGYPEFSCFEQRNNSLVFLGFREKKREVEERIEVAFISLPPLLPGGVDDGGEKRRESLSRRLKLLLYPFLHCLIPSLMMILIQ
jgi:hypothetical protein